MTPSLGWMKLLEQLIELKKPIYSLAYQFITKDIKDMNQQLDEGDTQGKVYGKGHRSAMLSPSMLSSQHLHKFPRLLEPCPLGFYEGFIT